MVRSPEIIKHLKNKTTIELSEKELDKYIEAINQLDSALMNQYKIHTVGIVWENISCVRVTPHAVGHRRTATSVRTPT